MQTTADLVRTMWPVSWTGQNMPYHVEGAGPGYDAALREMVRPWNDLYEAWVDALRPKSSLGDRHASDCRCPRCHRDDCHCRCCVADADLLVRTRVGERRVVPVIVENHWRREREIELQLSDFSVPGSEMKVTGQLIAPLKFTLKPCEEHSAILVVEVALDKLTDATNTQPADRVPSDVPGCVVSYADLRVIGCDVRPVRIAVAVLPRNCDAYRIGCRCGCC